MTAINLREGDAIETMDGMACITKIVKERHEEPVTVYNFHVKEWASYFVGEVRVYVHNGEDSGHKGLHNVAAWIKHDVYNEIRNKFGKNGVDKFVHSMKKGAVGKKNQNGIKMLSGKGVNVRGKNYSYEIKVKGSFGDSRVYGNYDKTSKHIIFNYFGDGKH